VPELQFKGKDLVYNHHMTSPFRPLEMHSDTSIGDARLDGNLIVHGTPLKSYAVRGRQSGNVCRGFLIAALREGERERIVVIETKGEQLVGNADTEYKRPLLRISTQRCRGASRGTRCEIAAVISSDCAILHTASSGDSTPC